MGRNGRRDRINHSTIESYSSSIECCSCRDAIHHSTIESYSPTIKCCGYRDAANHPTMESYRNTIEYCSSRNAINHSTMECYNRTNHFNWLVIRSYRGPYHPVSPIILCCSATVPRVLSIIRSRGVTNAAAAPFNRYCVAANRPAISLIPYSSGADRPVYSIFVPASSPNGDDAENACNSASGDGCEKTHATSSSRDDAENACNSASGDGCEKNARNVLFERRCGEKAPKTSYSHGTGNAPATVFRLHTL